MEDNELYEILQSYKEALDMITQRQSELDKMYEEGHDQMDERIHKLEGILYDEILGPAKEAMDKDGKYGDKLDAYNDKLKPIEGDDFDLSRKAYDDYNGIEGDKPDQDAYIAELTASVDKQLEAIKKAMGLEGSDKTIEVEKNGSEPAKVEVEDKETQEKEEEAGHGKEAEEAAETVPDGDEDEEVSISEEATEDDPEEVKKLMKEYEKYMGK